MILFFDNLSDPNKQELPHTQKVESDKKSEDSSHVSHEGLEGEGELFTEYCEAAAGEHNQENGHVGSIPGSWECQGISIKLKL